MQLRTDREVRERFVTLEKKQKRKKPRNHTTDVFKIALLDRGLYFLSLLVTYVPALVSYVRLVRDATEN